MNSHILPRMSMTAVRLGIALLAFINCSRAADLPEGLYAEFDTPRGHFICELYYRKVPLTVANFSGLAEGKLGPNPGTPFYDGLTFHRVVPDFVVQGGDPQGTGEGGPGYDFPDEFAPGLRHDDSGILSMANAGPDTNGSQFFLTLQPVNRLNYLHSVFGRIVQGRAVLAQIRSGDPMTKVRILRIGADAQRFGNDRAALEHLMAAAKRYSGQLEPGPQSAFEDADGLLPSEPPRATNFNIKLANVERATGLRIYARLQAQYTPTTPAQRVGNYTGQLAQQLGFTDSGILITYFADIDRWGLWVGEKQLPYLMGRPGTVKEFMQDSALHQAKQALLEEAMAQGDLFFKTLTAIRPIAHGDKLKCQTDAVLDAVITRFETAP
jgi:cyclophilin family peptidyl-prolyl cis-trans isomerase